MIWPGGLVRCLGTLASLALSLPRLPRIESVDSPSPPAAREIRVIASGLWTGFLPATKRRPRTPGRALLESGTDRAIDRQIQSRLGADGAGTGRKRRDDHHGARFPGTGDGAVAAARLDDRDGARRCTRP